MSEKSIKSEAMLMACSVVAAGAGDNQLSFLLEQAEAKWLPSALGLTWIFNVSSENLKSAAVLKGGLWRLFDAPGLC